MPPREMRRSIQVAFGNAKIDGRSEVRADDVRESRGRKSRIGF
jgi:ATP-dependent Lon protease